MDSITAAKRRCMGYLLAVIGGLMSVMVMAGVTPDPQSKSDVTVLPDKDSPICPPSLNRPCIALVLGGGGARGGAHIGVLRYLEEQQIPIDVVVGTSIGAFVGGLYASGKSVEDIETLFREANWQAGYQDNLSRGKIPNRRQQQIDQFPIQLDLGVGLDGVKLPRGFLQGQGMKSLVDALLGTYPRFASFNQLPIPFRAVGADIETGEEVVMASGDLATALHVSMSLPGVLRPIELNGRLLVDGGIANNLPISVAKALGADVVIAVDIGTPSLHKEDLASGLTIMRQLTSFLVNQNVTYQKSLLTDKDVYLHPEIDGVTLLSFEKVLDAEEAGYEEAKNVLGQSASLTTLQLAGAFEPSLDKTQPEFKVDSIVLKNQTSLADDYLLNRMGLEAGQTYTPADIQHGADRLYGQGTIARINTGLEQQDDQNILNVYVGEKEWGPGYLDFKLSFEDNFETVSRYQFGASYRLTNLSPYGAEWYTAAEFGTEKYITTELYWPLKTSGFYTKVLASKDRSVYEYLIDSSNSLGQLVTEEVLTLAGLGWNAIDSFDVLLAGVYTDGRLLLPTIVGDSFGVNSIGYQQFGGVLKINYDTLDDANFPTHGWKFAGDIYHTRNNILTEEDVSTHMDLALNGVFSVGRNSLRTQIKYQSSLNDDPLALLDSYSLGGFLNLSGNVKNSIVGQHVRFVSLVYTYELAANNFGAIDLPLYLGISAEAGNAWDKSNEIDYSDLIRSGSIFLGWNSPLGPAYLAYGQSDTGEKSFYAFLGVLF